jgi:outer membrane protein assembly factor BamB
MSLNHKIKLHLTTGIILFLLISFIFPNTIIAQHVDQGDGLWTDSFENETTTYRLDNGTSQCEWEDGTILLAHTATGGREYDFAGENDHKAYYYASALSINRFLISFLFSPSRHIAKSEHPFDEDFMYPFIQHQNESENRYAESSSAGYKKYAVQHFRFKLDGDADSIGDLEIYWYGKAENANKIYMYYWNYAQIALFSTWKSVNQTNENGDTELYCKLNNDELQTALDSNNYIDISIVAYNPVATCRLFTDYIKLNATQQEGYKIGYGFVQSNMTITIDANHYWDLLTWDDYQSGNAKIKYQILYEKSGDFIPIEDSFLEGNEEGFTTPPVSLSSIANIFKSIRIQANMSTQNPSISPKIYSWSLTWQKKNQWQDLFNSTFRLDDKNKVSIRNGSVNISLSIGDWPMFGQNPQNTRTTTGKAAYVKNLYWWSDYLENHNLTPSNPVIGGDSLYISARNQDNEGSLYKFDSIVVSSEDVGQNFDGSIEEFEQYDGKPIVGSPVIYNDYLIVATGKLNDKNYVYAFNKDAPGENASWIFDFSKNNSQHPNICYWGSPVVADGLLFLTGWSGDTSVSGYHTNNMILALDINNDGILRWNQSFPSSSPSYLSPTWSNSTPAVSNGTVIVGCMYDRGNNLFAFDELSGTLRWNASVGAIGKASPVIYNNTVYVVSEQKDLNGLMKRTKLTALDINDGNKLWETSLGRTMLETSLNPLYCLAQATPAVHDNVLYVTSPDGVVSALDLTRNGTELWSNPNLYQKILSSDEILTSSPAYADHILYVGTPNGTLYALDTNANGSRLWSRHTFPSPPTIPIVTDPVVTNGIMFFGAQNGRFYVCGVYVRPEEQINGSITSVPIHLPEGYWWKKFYVGMQTNSDTKINKITFSLLDEQKNFIKTLSNKSDILLQNATLNRTLRLHADFWAKNSSVNPELFFWNITFYQDTGDPFINLSSLYPNPGGWLNQVPEKFTINVVDNDTGLLINSAVYTIEYIKDNKTNWYTNNTFCSGINGTTLIQQIVVNLSSLSFYQNITTLRSLRINISDLAGNIASKKQTFYQDVDKPTSQINTQNMLSRYNSTYIRINATASDPGKINVTASGVKKVELYYRYSESKNFSGSWVYFGNKTKTTSPSWYFNFTNKPTQPGGYYELCTIAIDNANNNESFPANGDIIFLYDWKKPSYPSISGDTLWFKTRPQFSVVFEDDYRLDTIQYRPNFETIWTTLASHVNASIYNTDTAGHTWMLSQSDWDQMEEGEIYYLYLWVNDTLGNTLEILDGAHAITIRKDTAAPVVSINVPSVEDEWSASENFTVSGSGNDQDGSGINEALLYYRYSEDKSNWSSWIQYGDILNSSPFEWDFDAVEGDGYYEMKISVTDNAGNEVESEVFPLAVATFPATLVLVLVGLLVVLVLLSVIIYLTWRKKEKT